MQKHYGPGWVSFWLLAALTLHFVNFAYTHAAFTLCVEVRSLRGEPLKDATVTVGNHWDDPSEFPEATTDERGQAFICVRPGKCVWARADGYVSEGKAVNDYRPVMKFFIAKPAKNLPPPPGCIPLAESKQ